jgi:hypothetical protein
MAKSKSRYQRKSQPQRLRSYHVVGRNGVPCPRCGEPTEIREHMSITDKHLRQPYYFRRWFYCRNPSCSVTLHLVEDFKERRHSPCKTQS